MAKRKNVLKSTSELTLKQKAFVDIYVSNWGEITKVEAARRAGYKSNKPEGPTEIASRLTDPNKNPHVVRYMEMKYNQELKKHEGDKLKKYKRFETLSKKAEDKKQYAVAVNAEFRSGQMAGMFVDKKEVTHVGLEGMSREQLEKRLSELEGKIGEAKISLTLRQKRLVKTSQWMQVFNEIHNKHLNTSIGIVSILIKDKK